MLSFKIFTDLADCEGLWQQFSPNYYLYDDWKFRYLFNRARGFEPEFIVGYLDNEAIGLLPLQIHIKDDTDAPEKPAVYREYFGGYYMNDNRIYFKSKQREETGKYVSEFYDQVQKPSRLEYIIEDDEFLPKEKIKFIDNEYTLLLEGLSDYNDYLEQYWQGKSKRKMKKFITHVLNQNPIMSVGGVEDLPRLYELNIQRFGDESSYQSEKRREIFKVLTASEIQTDILKIEIAGEIKAVSFSILYNNTYYCLSSGIDLSESNLSKYFNLIKIQRAIELKATTINFLVGDYGYKHRWFPQLTPTYSYIND